MKLQTHIAFGLFFGMLFYYFFNLDFGLVLLVGFASFIPDIDWAMQFKWGLGERHRTFMHNVWAMIITSIIAFFLVKVPIVILGIILGFVSHMIADSLTVTGVYWFWPYGDEKYFGQQKKYWTGWILNMSDPNENKIERIIQISVLAASGFLFLIKGISINVFSYEGLISIGIFIFVGYILMKKFRNIIVDLIRRFKI
jgi:membrane-bound metal-dependent hydrolase YbcI (DUF457 family)